MNDVFSHPLRATECWSTRVIGSVLVFLLAVTGVTFATYHMLNHFPAWDDEGYMMLTVQRMLAGHPLYVDGSVPYGPFYYLTRWCVHALCGVPVNNDSFRLTAIVEWTASAAFFAVAAWRLLNRSLFAIPLALCCFVAGLIHLQAIAWEPGHPQETLVLLLSTALLIGSSFSSRKVWLSSFGLGSCCAAILLTKINVGVFFLLAVLLAMTASGHPGRVFRLLRFLVLIAALVLPILLLKSHLHEPWAQKFSALVIVSLFSCFLIAARPGPVMASRPMMLGFCSGLLSVTLLCVGFVMLHGGSPAELLNSILLKALRFPAVFGWPLKQSSFHTTLAFAGGLIAGIQLLPKSARWKRFIEETGLPVLKLLLGITILLVACKFSVVTQLSGENWPFSFAAGFLWLVLVPPRNKATNEFGSFARKLIAFTASLQVLQLYPVPGEQVYIGTITVILLGTILLGDAFTAVAAALAEHATSPALWLRLGACSLGIIPVGVLLDHVRMEKRGYYSVGEVSFPGCHLVRMPEDQASIYRCLADTMRASADTFVCKFGFNSLYFWSGKEPASTIPVSHSWQLFDATQQGQLLAANRPVKNLVFVDHPGFAPLERMFPIEKREIPFFTYVQQEMQPRFRVGDFKLYTRRGRDYLNLRSCARLQSSENSFGAMELQISLPDDAAGRQVSRVEVADFEKAGSLCKTDSQELSSRAVLLDEQGRDLFSNQSQSIAIPSHKVGWTLAIPAGIALEKLKMPVLRFYDGQRRLWTIPVAVEFSAESL